MKTLTLIRHSKSSWEDEDTNDFNRRLTKRGERDAKFMSELLAKQIQKPDLLLTSPTLRAQRTAEYFADAFDIDDDNIINDQGIYDRGAKYIIQFLKNLNNDISSVVLIGHNPDITTLANYFTGEYFDNIPTTGIVAIEFDISTWNEIEDKPGKLLFYEIPKKYFKKSK
ncbi:MAG TPA: histidine phosphatase family protein [Bacteroidota bacterium]|nr:histidine phosphatase family protein [Bacteroidota bacterium]